MGRMFGSLVGSRRKTCAAPSASLNPSRPRSCGWTKLTRPLSGRKSSGVTDGGTTARVFGTFLTWLSEKSAPVFVVATATMSPNCAGTVAQGAPGRNLLRGSASGGGAAEIFRIHLGKRNRRAEDFDLPALVAASQDFSGAEIEEAIISALYDAFYAREELSTAHVLEALGRPCRWPRPCPRKITAQRNWAKGRARNASIPALPRPLAKRQRNPPDSRGSFRPLARGASGRHHQCERPEIRNSKPEFQRRDAEAAENRRGFGVFCIRKLAVSCFCASPCGLCVSAFNPGFRISDFGGRRQVVPISARSPQRQFMVVNNLL